MPLPATGGREAKNKGWLDTSTLETGGVGGRAGDSSERLVQLQGWGASEGAWLLQHDLTCFAALQPPAQQHDASGDAQQQAPTDAASADAKAQ